MLNFLKFLSVPTIGFQLCYSNSNRIVQTNKRAGIHNSSEVTRESLLTDFSQEPFNCYVVKLHKQIPESDLVLLRSSLALHFGTLQFSHFFLSVSNAKPHIIIRA